MTPEALPELDPGHRAHLWELGWPLHLLYSHQRELSEAFNTSDARRYVVCCARRFGKSRWLCLEAVAFALRNPGAQVRYAAPTAKMVRSIIEPHMRAILVECPEHLKPAYARQEGVWRFPNGSEIHVAGCDNGGAERLRGTETHLGIVDEAGFVDELDYVVQDVLLPQTLTTDGRILLVSTPARTPAHSFTEYCARAEATGAYTRRTIHEATHVTPAQIEEYCEECGGPDSTTWQREFLAMTVVDEERAVVPEFTAREPELVEEFERPKYCYQWVVADNAFVDLSFWLFAVCDFDRALILVEDELVFHHKASSDMAPAVRAKEVELWGADVKPARRVDADPMARVEFAKADPDFSVGPVDNKDLHPTVNALRLATQRLQYRIHPRCINLIAHLKYAVWNKSKTNLERMDGFGHFDGVPAMMYLIKHADVRANPYPDLPEHVNAQDWHVDPRAIGTGARGLGRLKTRRRGRAMS